MSAHADDLRHYYAETIGESVIVQATAGGVLSPQLRPGRYLLHTRAVAGAATLWVRQGAFGELPAPAAATPATPLDLTETPRPKLGFMAKPAGRGSMGAASKATDGLTLRTDAGTVDVVLTRISRDE